MKKNYLIILLVIIILIIAGGIYYFYFFNKTNPDVIVSNKVTEERVENNIGQVEKKEPVIQNIENDKNDESSGPVKEDSAVKFTYRSGFRDPFQDYRIIEEVTDQKLTIEAIKKIVPFKLKGIIGSSRKRLAVIDLGNKTTIIENGYSLDEFKVFEIREEDLLMSYKGLQFTYEMESESDEAI